MSKQKQAFGCKSSLETRLDVSSGIEVAFNSIYKCLAGFLDWTKIDRITAVLVLP